MHDLGRTTAETTPLGHEMHEGEFHEIPLHEGEFHEGEYHEGEFHELPLHEGEFHEGEFHEAGLHEGEFHEGEMHEGEFHEGEFHEGEFHEGEHEGEFHEMHEGEFHEIPLHEMHEGEFHEAGLHEHEELELATELLEATNEHELDRFLGKLIRRVGRVIRSPVGRFVGGMLKGVAKRLLPIAGGALGTFVGGPMGGMVGSKLASMAGQAFGLELEGLSHEDREFEIARRYVRFATSAVRNAAQTSPGAPPMAAARSAVLAAARRYAPGLLQPRRCPPRYGSVPTGARFVDSMAASPVPVMGAVPGAAIPAGARRRGTWVRRGNRIILFGV